jgi:hypothetical protein
VSTPKPGSAEWQAELDRQIAAHDAEQQASGNDNETFEIGQPE